MSTTTLPSAPDTAELTAAFTLQGLLPPLVALTLEAKQVHWNVTGARFLPLHSLTDELADDARRWADRVAERAVALGSSVDGRPATVASIDGEGIPAGQLTDGEAITELSRRVGDVAQMARRTADDLGASDHVAHDIAIDVVEGLEKYLWMLRASAR